MKFHRHFTKNGVDPFSYIKWENTDVEVSNEVSKQIIFKLDGAEVPSNFDRNAMEILVSKYFKITEVPVEVEPVDETSKAGAKVPDWLRRSEPSSKIKKMESELIELKSRLGSSCDQKALNEAITDKRREYSQSFSYERSAKQVYHRLAGFWAYWGWMNGYFDTEDDARIFYDESIYMLENQIAAPNTPQFFNSGLYWAYGIKGEKKGFYRYNPEKHQVEETPNFYEFPGIHACHILSVKDSLFDPNGIYDNLTTEAKAFAIGGGCGKNTSNIRSKFEYLRTGNRASGSMEFALIDDKSAGTIKSGSNSRRAAKMVIKDIDDPEAPEFIMWKANEEKKVGVLAAGGYDAGWEGEAYKTVSGQNSNNSIRIPDKFMKLITTSEDWEMTARTTGGAVRKIKADDLWGLIVNSCWSSGDPGVQFDQIIQAWDTCPTDGRIRATNPCAEYVFKDDTSCNLASLNLQKLFEETNDKLKIEDFVYACRHWLTVLDISVDAAQLPSKQLAMGTHMYRTTGLGHTGIGAVLERAGVPYDSDDACHLVAAVTSLMTAQCYIMSAKLAHKLGTFDRYEDNKKQMMAVLKSHKLASIGNPKHEQYEIPIKPWEINHSILSKDLSKAVMDSWNEAISSGSKHGFRNAFVTLIQPSGTVGIVMGCDTTSIEPDYAIVKHKRLAGGGSMKMVNKSIEQALINLGYSNNQIEDMSIYITGNNTIDDAPFINRASLIAAGISEHDADMIEDQLDSATQLRDAVDPTKLSDDSISDIGLSHLSHDDLARVNIFRHMNFTKEQYVAATQWICGHGTLEGAPHIIPDHLPVFDCANRSGYGNRFLRWQAHVRMMSAVSPFISGGISKTLNMPHESTKKEMESAILMAYDGRTSGDEYCPGGVKCLAIYRDGSKKSQPLYNPYDISWWDQNTSTKVTVRGVRRRPPSKRSAIIHEVTIKNPAQYQKVIIKFGEYDDGSLAEIWIEVTRDNPSFFFAMKWASRAISNAIQYGMPLEDISRSFSNNEGGPGGPTDHPYITYCTSIIDLAIKLAMLEYEGDITFCKRKPPLHEIRCGRFKEKSDKKKDEEFKLEEKSVDLLKIIEGRCPKCGSLDINRYPCPACNRCGASLGGCSI